MMNGFMESSEQPLTDGSELHRATQQQARQKRKDRNQNGDSSVIGKVVHKTCCQCGTELSHRPRFKDSGGRYWCPQCNDSDHQKHRPAPCAGCGNEFLHAQLQSVSGEQLCALCLEQRRFQLKQNGGMEIKSIKTSAKVEAAGRRPRYVDLPKLLFGLAAILFAMLVLYLAL